MSVESAYKIYKIPGLILSILALMILTIMVLVICLTPAILDRRLTSTYIIYSSNICLLLFWLSTIFHCACSVIFFGDDSHAYDFDDSSYQLFRLLTLIFWESAYFSMYFLFIARLQQTAIIAKKAYTFKNTYAKLMGIIFVIILCFIIFIIGYSEDNNTAIMASAIFIGFATNLAFFSIMAYLYSKRLFEAVLLETELTDDINNNNNNNNNQNRRLSVLNVKQQQLIKYLIRYTALWSIAMVSFIIVNFSWGIYFSVDHRDKHFTMYIWYILPINVILNSFCVFMNLNMNIADYTYDNLCCYAHDLFAIFCVKIAKQKLRNVSLHKKIFERNYTEENNHSNDNNNNNNNNNNDNNDNNDNNNKTHGETEINVQVSIEQQNDEEEKSEE